jgi:hypothetical protein
MAGREITESEIQDILGELEEVGGFDPKQMRDAAYTKYLQGELNAQVIAYSDQLYKDLRASLTGIPSKESLSAAKDQAWRDAKTLVTQTTKGELTKIREIIRQGLEEGLHPDALKKRLGMVKGLDTNRAKSLTRYERYLDKKGITGEKRQRMLDRRFKKLLNDRKRTISTTEMRYATEQGSMLQARTRGNKFKTWITVGDSKVSDACAMNERAGWIAIDKEFPTGHGQPPEHPNCRCSLGYAPSIDDQDKEEVKKRADATAQAKAEGPKEKPKPKPPVVKPVKPVDKKNKEKSKEPSEAQKEKAKQAAAQEEAQRLRKEAERTALLKKEMEEMNKVQGSRPVSKPAWGSNDPADAGPRIRAQNKTGNKLVDTSVNAALNDVRSVHKAPGIPNLKVGVMKTGEIGEAEYVPYKNQIRFKKSIPKSMKQVLDSSAEDIHRFNALHEIGHHLDHCHNNVGKKRFSTFTHKKSPLGKDFMDIKKKLKETKAYQNMAARKAAARVGTNTYEYLEYAMGEEELFARAYVQWIAEKTDNINVQKVVYRWESLNGSQWHPNDFAEVSGMFDKAFVKEGLLE